MFKRLFKAIADWWKRSSTPYAGEYQEPLADKPRAKTDEERFREKFPDEVIPSWKEADVHLLKYCADKTLEAKALINLDLAGRPFNREHYEGVIFEPDDKQFAMLDPEGTRPSNKYALYLWEHCGWDRKLAESVGKEMRDTALLRERLAQLEDLEGEMKKVGYDYGVYTNGIGKHNWPPWRAKV